MSNIEMNEQDKAALQQKLQDYFRDELDHDIGRFEAQFLLDFLEKEMGARYYNQGLYDAQALLMQRVESVTEAIVDLEKPVG